MPSSRRAWPSDIETPTRCPTASLNMPMRRSIASLDRVTTIRLPHLLAALALWGYAEASARRIFGDRLGDPVAEASLEALWVRGPLTLTGLHAVFGRHRSAGELSSALERLEATGRARRAMRDTGGRPAEVWEAMG
jgi:hypothetical protein